LGKRRELPVAVGDSEVYEMEMAHAGSSSYNADRRDMKEYDYTEGASAIDIDHIVRQNRRARRDSQYSSLYGDDDDGGGAMFDGSGHAVKPSSVSRMSYTRRSTELLAGNRRKSMESVRSVA
jgi:cation-transporting ATPase 13A3/4/5